MRSFAQTQDQSRRKAPGYIVKSHTVSRPGSTQSLPTSEGPPQSACACGGGCPKCQAKQGAIRSTAEINDGGQSKVPMQVDAGVPPAKKSPAPPAQKPGATPPKAPSCTFKITYANEQSLPCGAAGTRGAISHFDITKVQADGAGCPATLDGLRLTEEVTSDHGCHPQDPKIGDGCTIRADASKPHEGKFKDCSDNYALCGDDQAFLFMGCTEVLTQKVFIDGTLAEVHKITFKIPRRGEQPPGTATRK